MRIVSLVPSATEMLFALGVGDEVTAVTHECDHPPEALDLPKVTRDVIGPGLPAAEIDRAVKELTQQGKAIYELDEDALRRLQPDLIVTQQLCAVCAVSYEDVQAVAERLESQPQVISLDPNTLGEVLGDVRTLAQATDAKDAGVDLVQEAASRIDRVRLAVRAAEPVRVAALEWLDPVFVAGHWTPQLIEYAGGFDVLGMPGEHSEQVDWDTVRAAEPEVVVVMPCGYDGERALEEAYDYADELE
jgi:iron complex transport system substrate-binding protein